MLPASIASTLDEFHATMTDAELRDPAFSYRVAFVPKLGSKASKSDVAVEFIGADSDKAKSINSVLLKEIDKARYTAGQIISAMQAKGFPGFNQFHHIALWKELDAKDPSKGFGREGDYKGTWVWFDSWLARVRIHCEENAQKYGCKAD